MSNEFRRDPLTGEWVTIVGARQDRPNLPAENCPFCVGGLEAPDPYVVKAFANRWPAMEPGLPLTPVVGPEPFTSRPARGAAEVILYSPEHDATMATIGIDGVRAVIDLWAERTAELCRRPEIEYVLIFENRGREVGATIDHPHGQIYAFPFVPPEAEREFVLARHGEPLAAIAAAELAAEVRVVQRIGEWVAWVPFASAWPYGLVLAPRTRVASLPDLDDDSRNDLAALLTDVLARFDGLFPETAPFPYMLWIHQAPARTNREIAHLHIHLAPPRRSASTLRYVAAGELGSGVFSNPVVPERAAAQLRNTLR